MDDMRERVIGLLKERGVLHIRQLIRELNSSYTQVKRILDQLVGEGVIERFSHGGYTFYRLVREVKEGEEGEPPTS